MPRQLWIGALCTIALVGLWASRASAFAFDMVPRTPTTGLDVSDSVTVDVFFDATDVDVYAFDLRVLSSNASAIHYDATASAALEASGDAGPGTQPAYILYDPGIGMSLPAVALYPFQTPVWPTWPTPPPGEEEVQIGFLIPNLTGPYGTRTTGTGIWIASLVFHVGSAITSESLALSVSSLQQGFGPYPVDQIGLSSPITLTGVPEPATGLLMGVALVAGVARSARRPA
jgi:hypothetical protein